MSRAAPSVFVVLRIIMARPVAARVSFGSPADPPRAALGGGAFDTIAQLDRGKLEAGRAWSPHIPLGFARSDSAVGNVSLRRVIASSWVNYHC
jgi:hypothetical protein